MSRNFVTPDCLRSPVRRTTHRRRGARSYAIESLESRLLMAATSWLAAVDGNWNDATKWSAGIPTATSDAMITAAGTFTVTVPGGNFSTSTLTLGAAGSNPTLRVAG